MTDPIAEIHVASEIVLLVLAALGVVLGMRVVRRLDGLNEAALSTRMFLRAMPVRRYIQVFSSAVVLFVLVPLTDLGKLIGSAEEIEVVHDLSNIVFIAVALMGLVGLDRALKAGPAPR